MFIKTPDYLTLSTLAKDTLGVDSFSFCKKSPFKKCTTWKNTKEDKFASDSWFWKNSTGRMGSQENKEEKNVYVYWRENQIKSNIYACVCNNS